MTLALQTSGSSAGNFFALKVLQDAYNETNIVRFQTEVAALTRLKHPSILQIVDSGEYRTEQSTYPFYLCDYYPETLSKANKRGLSLPLRLAFAIQMISGLAYLESQSIIHCDIKPDNIFVGGFNCVLADFGLVRLPSANGDEPLGPSLHRYRSPDIAAFQAKGIEPTAKSDVFQLGLVFSELFTGTNICRPAAKGSDLVELDELPRIHGNVGANLETLIKSMLRMDSTKRPAASDLKDRLQNILFQVIEHRWKQEDRVF